jgi:hypothetical protein
MSSDKDFWSESERGDIPDKPVFYKSDITKMSLFHPPYYPTVFLGKEKVPVCINVANLYQYSKYFRILVDSSNFSLEGLQFLHERPYSNIMKLIWLVLNGIVETGEELTINLSTQDKLLYLKYADELLANTPDWGFGDWFCFTNDEILEDMCDPKIASQIDPKDFLSISSQGTIKKALRMWQETMDPATLDDYKKEFLIETVKE